MYYFELDQVQRELARQGALPQIASDHVGNSILWGMVCWGLLDLCASW